MVVAAGEITPYLPWIACCRQMLQVIDGPFTVPAQLEVWLHFSFAYVLSLTLFCAAVLRCCWAAKRGLIYLWVWLHGRGKRAALFF